MKRTMYKLKVATFSFFRDGLNRFYVLAFAPLFLIMYFYIEWPFSIAIPVFGFIILMLKNRKLSSLRGADRVQQIVGLLLMFASFFVHYALLPFFPSTAYYGNANYALYLVGLFLLFFELSALKEAFSPVFLIVAATSSFLISTWLKPLLSPYANDFAHIIMNILRALGIDAQIHSIGDIAILTVPSLSGEMVSGSFVYECLGVYSALVFSIILIVILSEDPSSLKVKLAYSLVGLLGTFAVNILRVTTIFLVDYFYGAEVGGTVHYIIGYALFSAWLACFFYIYSKRQTLHGGIKSFRKRIAKMRKIG